MKVLKLLGTGLVLIILLWVFISLFLPSTVHIERSVLINSNPELVFDQINNLKKWQYWSYWDNLDPDMTSEFEGPDEGVGAVHKWKSEHPQVGDGSMTITQSEPPSKVITSIAFGEMPPNDAGWLIKNNTAASSEVVGYINIDVGFLGRVFPGLMLDGWMGPDFEKTLNNLKAYCQSVIIEKEQRYPIEEVLTPQVQVMSMEVTCTAADISKALGESYGKLMAEVMKQKLTMTGAPMAIYHSYSDEEVKMEPCIPVQKAGKSNDDVIAKSLPSVRALKVDYLGNYNNLGDVHDFIAEYAAEEHIRLEGSPWESYVTDPGAEPDTSKWLTQVYYPLPTP